MSGAGRRALTVRVGLLGGSFDPIHHGHLIAAAVLRETLQLDAVRLVVAHEQPFKVGQHAAPADARWAMVRLACGEADGLSAEGIELERPGPSYTVETLRRLRAREPEVNWVLLVGADAMREFRAWRDAEAIPSLARVVSFGRGGDPAPAGIETVPVPRLEISASAIRARVRAGRSIRYWVPDAVAAYITAHGLYQDRNA